MRAGPGREKTKEAATEAAPFLFMEIVIEAAYCALISVPGTDEWLMHSLWMQRYFFNVHNVQPSTDEIGEELPNDDAAWKEATMIAGEFLKDIDGKFRPGQEWSLEVTDEGQEAAVLYPR